MAEAKPRNRILVIDDEEMIRKLFKRCLETKGYEVTCCKNGDKGIEAFREDPSDLVITDLSMPGKDGVTVIQEIKQIRPMVPVFAISGDTAGAYEHGLADASESGAVFVFTKPVELKEIETVIAELLSRA